MAHTLKVFGPNIKGGYFNQGYDVYSLDDPVAQTEVEEGFLMIKLPPVPAQEERHVGTRRIPARRAIGEQTIVYAPGQWTKTITYERIEDPS